MVGLIRVFAAGFIAVSLSAFQIAPAALPPGLDALADDPAAARSFDYMALKAQGADLGAHADAIYRRTQTAPGVRRCMTAGEAEMQASLLAAKEATDTAAFEDDRAAASDAWGKWGLFTEGLGHGQVATEPPFSWVSERLTEAAAQTDPRVRELLMRTARDQLIRRGYEGGVQVWGELSPGAEARVMTALNNQMCEADLANTAWLKADIAANGWFLISTTGEEASRAAWLMTQHADRDLPFQKHVLSILEPLAAAGEASMGNFAYLYDRVAMNENRPIRYGTQGRCVARNVWGPLDLEDPDRIEALRAEADIGSLAEYAAHMNRYCADFEG